MKLPEEHIVPRGDLLMDHERTDDCPCGPTADPVQRGDGSIEWVIVHRPFDGQECATPPAELPW